MARRRMNTDHGLREFRRRVLAGGAGDAGDVVALAAAMTRAGDIGRMGAEVARRLSRTLFWLDVRRIAAEVELRSDIDLTWDDAGDRLRALCEQSGRLASPDGQREILAQAPFSLGAGRRAHVNELVLARDVFVSCVQAESVRQRRWPMMPMHGLRVRFAVRFDAYPHFFVPEGATGTVVRSAGYDDPSIVVRVDQMLDDAGEWDNEVYWPLDRDNEVMRSEGFDGVVEPIE